MSLKSRAILRMARKRPHYLLVPFLPMAMMVANFLLALTALHRVREVSRHAT